MTLNRLRCLPAFLKTSLSGVSTILAILPTKCGHLIKISSQLVVGTLYITGKPQKISQQNTIPISKRMVLKHTFPPWDI